MKKLLPKYFIKIVLSFLHLIFFLNSCKEIDVFEKNIPIPNMQWYSNYNAKGSFIINDTNSTYNVLLVIRHTDAYQYNNVWLNVGLQPPGFAELQFQKINLSLGNDAHGWEGVGMNDIWDVRKLISGVPKRFIKAGEYKFSIAQLMRDNPLLHIISVGVNIQKTK